MTVRQPRYPQEESARRGNEIYESPVRSQVEEGNHGSIVAIAIETGAFEVADHSFPGSSWECPSRGSASHFLPGHLLP
jgi:hypothetical protein